MTHFTPWADDEGFGYSVYVPSQYQGGELHRGRPTFLRLQLAQPAAPAFRSGDFPPGASSGQPRFWRGLYDLTGKGNTVVRGADGAGFYLPLRAVYVRPGILRPDRKTVTFVAFQLIGKPAINSRAKTKHVYDS